MKRLYSAADGSAVCQRELGAGRDRAGRRPQPPEIVPGIHRREDEARGPRVVHDQALSRQLGIPLRGRVEDVAMLLAAILGTAEASVLEAVALGVVGQLIDHRADALAGARDK